MDYQYIRQFGNKSPVALQSVAIPAGSPSMGLFFGHSPSVGCFAKWLSSAKNKKLYLVIRQTRQRMIDNLDFAPEASRAAGIRAPFNQRVLQRHLFTEN